MALIVAVSLMVRVDGQLANVLNGFGCLQMDVRTTVAIVAEAILVERFALLSLVSRVAATVRAKFTQSMGEQTPIVVGAGVVLAEVQAKFRLVASLVVVAIGRQ